jgi:hypothetical protein
MLHRESLRDALPVAALRRTSVRKRNASFLAEGLFERNPRRTQSVCQRRKGEILMRLEKTA